MDSTESEKELKGILETCRVLAVVGMSRDSGKAAGRVPRYLASRGYAVIPVNPNARHIDGLKAYPSLKEVEKTLDAVVIFRPSREVMKHVREAVARKESRGDLRVVWMQEGIRDDEAARLAEEHGLVVVQDRCMAKEHARFFRRSGK